MNKVEKSIMTKSNEEYLKSLYMIDMNNGFVNFGMMANPEYNKLVPEQLRLIEKFRREGELVNFILEGHDENAQEFLTYPKHCVLGTDEALLIPEFVGEQVKPDTRTYYKNSINGMLNRTLQEDLVALKNLKEIVIGGVCADLCVMDFGRTELRFLDEINRDIVMFVVKSCIDTFDLPGHDRNEWLDIAYKVLAQAGAIIVDNVDELEEKEKIYVKK